MYIILICGDRNWHDTAMIEKVLAKVTEDAGYSDESFRVIHGSAKGADKLGADIAYAQGIRDIVAFPTDWKSNGITAGPRRNREMLAAKPDIVLAFHPYLLNSKGTKDMVNIALAKGIKVLLNGIEYDGNYQHWFEEARRQGVL